jgi:hypothetical protein
MMNQTHTVYCAYARLNGKPAGFVGMFRTRREASEAHSGLSTLVKRERISEATYSAWSASGFKPRGWAAN